MANKSQPRLVVLTTTAGPGPAEIIRAALEAAGLSATTSQEGAGAAFGFTVGPLGLVDVLVPETQLAEAEALLASLPGGDTGEDEAADNPS